MLLNDRFWLLCFSFLLSIFTWIAVWQLVPAGELRIIRLEQSYGFIAIAYLYSALLVSPLAKAFPKLPGKKKFDFLRRAIGVSTFYFASLHAGIAFFGQLKGFGGIAFLGSRYALALILGVIALAILFCMAITSFDKAIEIMSFKRWKQLHRFVYLGGWLIMAHVIIIGTHFSGSTSLIGRIVFVAVIFLLLLEALRIDKLLKERVSKLRHIGIATMLVLHAMFIGFGYVIGKSTSLPQAATESSHGHTTAHQTTSQDVDGQRIEINQLRFSLQDVTDGTQTITFRITPGLTNQVPDCFLINLDTHAYLAAAAETLPNGEISCKLAKTTKNIELGGYSVFIRLTSGDQTVATKFDVDLQ